MATEIANPTDAAFASLDSTLSRNEIRREKMLEKLLPIIDKVEIENPNDMRATDRESIMGMFSTADSIMKSQEAGRVNNVRVILAKKTEETNANYADTVVELLKQIKPGDVIPPSIGDKPSDPNAVDGELNAAFQEDGDDISEDEITAVGTGD